uniref:Uncharacterized protein n=1 Tax=Avena sativa TaxID=4498 RepID=A0ACD6ARN5_AVESA
MAGRRRKTGQRRMDAAIDHFAPMGYNKADVRKIINNLLKNVYGDNGWPLLEENCYLVVQEALFEKQEEEEKLQLQLLREEGEEAQACVTLVGNNPTAIPSQKKNLAQ